MALLIWDTSNISNDWSLGPAFGACPRRWRCNHACRISWSTCGLHHICTDWYAVKSLNYHLSSPLVSLLWKSNGNKVPTVWGKMADWCQWYWSTHYRCCGLCCVFHFKWSSTCQNFMKKNAYCPYINLFIIWFYLAPLRRLWWCAVHRSWHWKNFRSLR